MTLISVLRCLYGTNNKKKTSDFDQFTTENECFRSVLTQNNCYRAVFRLNPDKKQVVPIDYNPK